MPVWLRDRLVVASEVVVHEAQAHRVGVALNLLRERVGEPREAAHPHQDEPRPQPGFGHFGQPRMAWMHDVAALLAECLAERQVVLVDEEPGGQGSLRGEGAELLLVHDRGPNLFVR